MHSKNSSRRSFLKNAGTVGLGFLGMKSLLGANLLPAAAGTTALTKNRVIEKYGPLVKDPAGIFDLPSGFSYKIISTRGEVMSDGFLSPDKPDGMAAFPGSKGRIILIRNHELLPNNFGPFGKDGSLFAQIDPKKVYDPGNKKNRCNGGTSTLVIREEDLTLERSFLSLAGTMRNCAGGPTPWGSWISCEEIFAGPGDEPLQEKHGYNFEVPATESIRLADPVPLKEMGRFQHEAVALDPHTGIVYQTEDLADGLIYRFIPHQPGQLHLGGRLQALAILGEKSRDTRNWSEPVFPAGQLHKVEWVDLEEVDAPVDDLRYRGFARGAARFGRGEGMWFGSNECYFACTAGGKQKLGQIFRYIPSPFEGSSGEKYEPGRLELFLESQDSEVLQWCDNLTVAPWGDLILCEDNTSPDLVGVTPKGELYKLGHNSGFASELAGCVFSPSGRTLFVNIQHAGLTLAIQGPWESGKS